MIELALQKALRLSDARYRRLFEAALDGILLLNAETAQIEDVNPFLIELLGYSHDEFLGKKIWEIGAFKDTALNRETFVELQTRHYVRYDDLPLVAKDGTRVSVEFVSNLYDCEGIDVIQCNIRDNTKRHLAEIALKVTTRSLQMLSESNVALLGANAARQRPSRHRHTDRAGPVHRRCGYRPSYDALAQCRIGAWLPFNHRAAVSAL